MLDAAASRLVSSLPLFFPLSLFPFILLAKGAESVCWCKWTREEISVGSWFSCLLTLVVSSGLSGKSLQPELGKAAPLPSACDFLGITWPHWVPDENSLGTDNGSREGAALYGLYCSVFYTKEGPVRGAEERVKEGSPYSEEAWWLF